MDFEKYEEVINMYMPKYDEGETKASQLATAINRLIYRWDNDGDVYDNRHMEGYNDDVPPQANWIYKNYPESRKILNHIDKAYSRDDYEHILDDLADKFINEKFLREENKQPKTGTIYNCDGPFEVIGERWR